MKLIALGIEELYMCCT